MKKHVSTGLFTIMVMVISGSYDDVAAQCGACLQDSDPLGHSVVPAIWEDTTPQHWWVWGSTCMGHDDECATFGFDGAEQLELLAMANNAFTLAPWELESVARALGAELDRGAGILRFRSCPTLLGGGLVEVPTRSRGTNGQDG